MATAKFKIKSVKTLVAEIDFSEMSGARFAKTEELLSLVRQRFGENAIPEYTSIHVDYGKQVVLFYRFTHNVSRV